MSTSIKFTCPANAPKDKRKEEIFAFVLKCHVMPGDCEDVTSGGASYDQVSETIEAWEC